MLRARLRYFNVDRDVRLVLITSATPGDGKSTITLGLAEAAASMGARVLMIEADLRRPALANLLGLSAGPGLAEAIVGVATLEEAVQEARIGGQEGEDLELHGAFAQARAEGEGAQLHGAEGEGAQLHGAEGEGAQLHRAVGERAGREGVQLEGARREHAHTHLPGARALRSQVGSVSLLSAGYGVPNPTGMIESRAIEEVLSWAGSIYDLVLIDTPPMSVVPDAIPLLRKVDGVIVVGRLRANSAEQAARLAEELRSLEAPTLGVVANGVKARDSGYGYAYRYAPGRGEAKESRTRQRPLARSAP
jgi:Mrp family chromosome partitioning ATPase